jgi:glycosyltransferase involved in cell wall biosynthesis
MACGLPVISTKVGGIPDYLDTNAGWLFPPGDVESISKLVEHLSKNPVDLVNKSKAARAKAETFSWPEISKQVLRFYDSVLRQKDKKPS